jgi:hypothetical protein
MGLEASTAAMMDKCTKPLGVWAAGEKWELEEGCLLLFTLFRLAQRQHGVHRS